ncbi:hypothetical protein QR680_008861 [Steinernema hermaphroditum]|uniref:Uncharacterized protein n=1 Tax=Steinernema hermaphroditum TaxID=289476 RepID=A0AA39IJK7_9BILA|nr:hypothetical protein QR680_008861 [Steinernema hermaphroditum]
MTVGRWMEGVLLLVLLASALSISPNVFRNLPYGHIDEIQPGLLRSQTKQRTAHSYPEADYGADYYEFLEEGDPNFPEKVAVEHTTVTSTTSAAAPDSTTQSTRSSTTTTQRTTSEKSPETEAAVIIGNYIIGPTECTVGMWGEWFYSAESKCSADCGGCGKRKRIRRCLSMEQGCPCIGLSEEWVPCNIGVCQYPYPSCCLPFQLIYVDGKFACGPQSQKSFQDLVVNNQMFMTFVEIRRPKDTSNSITLKTFEEIEELFTFLRFDADTRAVVLFSTGPNFVGAVEDDDLTAAITNPVAYKKLDPPRKAIPIRDAMNISRKACNAIANCGKPVIAAIHGKCVGAGMDLVAACDIRYCTEATNFMFKDLALGTASHSGSISRLHKLTGKNGFIGEMILNGQNFSGVAALRYGFVSKVLRDQPTLFDVVKKTVYRIAWQNPIDIIAAKSTLDFSATHTVAETRAHTMSISMSLLLCDDFLRFEDTAKKKDRYARTDYALIRCFPPKPFYGQKPKKMAPKKENENGVAKKKEAKKPKVQNEGRKKKVEEGKQAKIEEGKQSKDEDELSKNVVQKKDKSLRLEEPKKGAYLEMSRRSGRVRARRKGVEKKKKTAA